MSAPLTFQWSGEALVPQRPRQADREFVIGEVYRMAVEHERSAASHRHYFAALNEAWGSLPEDVTDRHPSVEHLRKYALIRTGYRDERSIVCASKSEAMRIAAFIRPVDDMCIVTSSEATVFVYTAKSQSVKAMGREAFQKSKDDVLGYVAGLLGVSADSLNKHARAA